MSTASELLKLRKLLDSGVLTEEELIVMFPYRPYFNLSIR